MKNFFLIFLLLIIGCNKSKNNVCTNHTSVEAEQLVKNEILVVDVKKDYSQTNPIYIQDIAKVEYIPLETKKDYICKGYIAFIDDSLIICINWQGNDILLFNQEGKALKRINRKGQSGEEYTSLGGLAVDIKNSELYINDMWRKKIFVYDINGNYLRSFSHLGGEQYSNIYNLNERALLCYGGNPNKFYEEKYPFKIISKKNGELLKDVEIPFTKRIDLTYREKMENGRVMFFVGYTAEPAIEIAKNDMILKEVSSDTIYRLSSEDFSITPYMIQTPSIQSMDENEQYLVFVMNTFDYQFMYTQKREFNKKAMMSGIGFPTTCLIYDKKKKGIFKLNIYNKDVKDESIEFSNQGKNNQVIYRYQAYELKKFLKKGELSGKLKEIAEKMDEEDNPVLMVITFK